MLQFPEKTHPDARPSFPPLVLASQHSSKSSSDGSEKSPTSESSPRMPGDAVAGNEAIRASSIINAAVAARKRGNLSHLSESDRRSEFSYRSESISMALSDPHRITTKFKVVKLGDKVPYTRGRFVCFDFHDIPNKERGVEPMLSAASSRMSTPDVGGIVGAGGTLTARIMANGPSGGDAADVEVVSLCQAEPVPFHNLHHRASGPVSPGIAVIQRTGTLVQSPVVPKSAPVFPSQAKSPLPWPSSANTSSSPEPSRMLPVYSADGTPKESPETGTSKRSPPAQALTNPLETLVKRHSDLTSARTTSPPVGSRKISLQVSSSPEPLRLLPVYSADGTPKEPPVAAPDNSPEIGAKRRLLSDPSVSVGDQVDSGTPIPSPAASAPPSRKVSDGTPSSPEPSRLLPVFTADGTLKEVLTENGARKSLPVDSGEKKTFQVDLVTSPRTAGQLVADTPARKLSDVVPTKVLPVYSADGSPKEHAGEQNGTVRAIPSGSAETPGESAPKKFFPVNGDLLTSSRIVSPVPAGPARRISEGVPEATAKSVPVKDSAPNGPPEHHPAELTSRQNSSSVNGDVGSKRVPPVNSDLLTSARTAGSAPPSRKISAATGPDPSRLLRLKGETYFAEMIDRVWETAATTRPAAPEPSATGGFDSVRIEAKISQCMSLVTEHVLMAVRADLDQLTVKAQALRERAAALEYENHVLRTENVLLRNTVMAPSVVAALSGSAADVAPSRSRMKL